MKGIFTGGSLARLADKMNPTLQSFVRDQLSPSERSLVNIITVDHEDHSDVVDVCKYLLSERPKSTLNRSLETECQLGGEGARLRDIAAASSCGKGGESQ